MLGQSAFTRGSTATANNRIFVYEVAGLQQNDDSQSNVQIRTSANTFVQVPYNRMNEKMQQILRMGGKIVSIQPLGAKPPAAESES
ncbi:phycobilisome linker polypeptide [Chamaesiphon minutus]|uniref:CpcD/allophycocyanin linker domain protein n=1 Tax=Chamaesiphon minutus (strain ATCC 27169 / PCC 6605) TaxID=1173020 RepID=K9UK40_CHAP6|nr:phycobilisome linker polypeptide [Chamaesiphon minutus]AFY95033.1 CpcD/allophycocyanin linker domain protein [Chamaesiphon minutus PCC 6605]